MKEFLKILLADPDGFVRDLAAYYLSEECWHYLSKGHWQVTSFGDGYDALDWARKEMPTLLLAEVMLPRLDGLALCRLLKSDSVTAGIKIVLFSNLRAADSASAAGADAFVQKPIERHRLLSTLDRLIETPKIGHLHGVNECERQF